MRRPFLLLIIVFLLAVSCSRGGRSAEEKYFALEQRDGCSIVTIFDPWVEGKTRDIYILIPRDSQVPSDLPAGKIIRTPVERAAVCSSLHASIIEQIGAANHICGICEPQYLTNNNVKELVDDGKIANLGLFTSPDAEKIIDLEADLIIATPFENSGYGNAEKLGIPIFEAADYMENTPLNRASWVQLFGLLFGCEAQADSLLRATTDNYVSLKALAASAHSKPTVVLEKKYGASWGMPAGESYIATMHSDAGADYIFHDIPGTNSRQLTFEEVLDKASGADFWLIKLRFTNGEFTYRSLEQEYQPYSYFEAFKKRSIFGCNTLNVPYYDDIAIHPDWILADFIKIYHPDLLPDYELRYYKPLAQ